VINGALGRAAVIFPTMVDDEASSFPILVDRICRDETLFQIGEHIFIDFLHAHLIDFSLNPLVYTAFVSVSVGYLRHEERENKHQNQLK
jgi:hypothetical protein